MAIESRAPQSQSASRIGDSDPRCPFRTDIRPFHHRRARTVRKGVGNIIVAVVLNTGKREKNPAFVCLTRIVSKPLYFALEMAVRFFNVANREKILHAHRSSAFELQ